MRASAQYTAITRARRSPWQGGLRVTGIGNVLELREAARVHPRALTYMHAHGRRVPAELLEAASDWVREHEARWAAARA